MGDLSVRFRSSAKWYFNCPTILLAWVSSCNPSLKTAWPKPCFTLQRYLTVWQNLYEDNTKSFSVANSESSHNEAHRSPSLFSPLKPAFTIQGAFGHTSPKPVQSLLQRRLSTWSMLTQFTKPFLGCRINLWEVRVVTISP